MIRNVITTLHGNTPAAPDLSDPEGKHKRFPHLPRRHLPCGKLPVVPNLFRTSALMDYSIFRVPVIRIHPIREDPAEGLKIRQFFRVFQKVCRCIRSLNRIAPQITRELLVKPLHHILEVRFNGLCPSVVRIGSSQFDPQSAKNRVFLPGKFHGLGKSLRLIIFPVIKISLRRCMPAGNAAVLRKQHDLFFGRNRFNGDQPGDETPAPGIHQSRQRRFRPGQFPVMVIGADHGIKRSAVSDDHVSGRNALPITFSIIRTSVPPCHFPFTGADDHIFREMLNIEPNLRQRWNLSNALFRKRISSITPTFSNALPVLVHVKPIEVYHEVLILSGQTVLIAPFVVIRKRKQLFLRIRDPLEPFLPVPVIVVSQL